MPEEPVPTPRLYRLDEIRRRQAATERHSEEDLLDQVEQRRQSAERHDSQMRWDERADELGLTRFRHQTAHINRMNWLKFATGVLALIFTVRGVAHATSVVQAGEALAEWFR
ncbi:MAG TPA: hypothetical protein VI318_00725 [Baekduia sp.]